MNEFQRFFTLRQRVFDAIDRIVNDPEDDGFHKSYEGAMDVEFSFSNYFAADGDVRRMDCVKITLHCYLLINGRHESWYGQTFAEALQKAEVGVAEILKIMEDENT